MKGTMSPQAPDSILPQTTEVDAVDSGWDDEPQAAAPTAVPPPPPPPRGSFPTLEHPNPAAFDRPTGPQSVLPPTTRMAEAFPRPAAAQPSAPPSAAPGYGYRTSQRPDFCSEMKARFAEGDFSGALLFAEALLEFDKKHPDALTYAKSCREGLAEVYLEILGSRATVLRMMVAPDVLSRMELSAQAGFVASLVDGSSTIDELLDLSGMEEHETLRVLSDLLGAGVVCAR